MNFQKRHILLWITAILLIVCAWTVSASAADIKEHDDGCVVDYSDKNHAVLLRYEGPLTEIGTKDENNIFKAHDIKVIGGSCFFGNQDLVTVVLPNTIEAIHVRSFADCPKLTKVTLSTKLKLIPNEAFQDCPSLNSIQIPYGVTSIGVNAFQNCITLKAAEGQTRVKDKWGDIYYPIPSTVTTVSSGAFANCPKLVISCYKGSAPETYAIANGIRYESLDPVVEKISVKDSEGDLAQITVIAGQTLTITPTIEPAIAAKQPLGWSSSDRTIATVSENGEVTGVKEGICWVTIASEDINQIGAIGVETDIKIVVLASGGDAWRRNLPDGNIYYRVSGTEYAKNFRKIGAYTYHFNKYGHMSIGWRRGLSGKDYFFRWDGIMITGWYEPDGAGAGWYYFDSDGPAHKGWLSFEDPNYKSKKKNDKKYLWYFLDKSSGLMYTGYRVIDNTPYFFKADGLMADAGWVRGPGGTWYYANENGVLVRGWIKLNKKWYYLDENNAEMIANAFRRLGNSIYYFNSAGEMLTGWIRAEGNWYYADANGALVMGWLQLGKDWYYFAAPNGTMVTGEQKIDGKTYRFDGNGVWIP